MITHDQAFTADEFHVEHAGLPCEMWYRSTDTSPLVNGGFMVFIYRNEGPRDNPLRRDSDTLWHHITGVNAHEFHAPEDCPRRAGNADQPPASDRSEDQPELRSTASAYGPDGYDANGYDRNGRDAAGYDIYGYDEDGYDRDGYNAGGYDADGYDRRGHHRLPDAEDLDLDELWAGFWPSQWNASAAKREEFRQHLREMVRDPDAIDDLQFCDNCHEPAWEDNLRHTGTREDICETCWDDWCFCDSCEERFPSDDLHEMLSGSEVCNHCRDNYYTWCDDCDGYYNDEYSYDHEHDSDGDGCCESPQLRFRIRNDGQEPLKQDQRVTVTLPAGVITAEGLKEIRRYLRGSGHFDLAYDLDGLGDQWQTREGNYAKRLSRHAYKQHQAKLTPEVMSRVGTIASDHSRPVDVRIEITRDLNRPPGDFHHEESCWWGSYSESRCAAKTNGVFGLLTYADNDRTYPSGRAWVMPLKLDERGRLTPTFETMTPDAFVTFNGYGDLEDYAPARIIAHMAGWTYRKISFSCSPMYINAGGYLIAPEHVAEPYTDGCLTLSVRQHSSLYTREQNDA